MNSQVYYDLLAGEYEEQNEFWDNHYDTEVWRLEHAIIRPYLDLSKPILDVGCGFYPHDNFAPSTRIIAGDISFGSLIVARDHPLEGRRVDFVQFDAHHLPFRDNSFCQAVAGGELLNHVEYRSVVAELARVISTHGILLVEFGTRWCLDSLWAIIDSALGHRIGYSVTKEQAKAFFHCDGSDVEVTWGITPRGKFMVKLLAVSNVCNALTEAGFIVERVVSTNCLSGIIPLPWQQDPERPIAQVLTKWLILTDRILGKIYPINLFAGNVLMLCKRRKG